MAEKTTGSRITLDEFTEVTLSAVTRAIEARQDRRGKFIPGPIIFGIIWWPEGGPLNVASIDKPQMPRNR